MNALTFLLDTSLINAQTIIEWNTGHSEPSFQYRLRLVRGLTEPCPVVSPQSLRNIERLPLHVRVVVSDIKGAPGPWASGLYKTPPHLVPYSSPI